MTQGYEDLRAKLKPKLVDYFKLDSIPFYEPELGTCPHCRSYCKIINKELWCCPVCGKEGDIVDYVLVNNHFPSPEKAIRHLCRMLGIKNTEMEYYSADEIMEMEFSEPVYIVDKLISKLAKPGTQVLQCYNKVDLVSREDIPVGQDVVAISAAKGEGMDRLLHAIEKALDQGLHHVVVTLPYSMGGMVETLHSGAQVKSVEYTADGIEIETVVDEILYGRLKEYVTKEC